MRRQPAYLLLAIAILAAACKSKPKTEGKTQQPAENPDSEVPAFIAQFPEPANENFNGKVIDVSTFQALYNNLGSNRTIRLMADITIPDEWKENSNLNLELRFGLIVRGLSNLKITSGGQKPYRLIQPNRTFKVMELYKCENVVFDNIIASHEPEKGTCSASVLVFNECSDVFIYNSVLYGSGYEGITAYKTKNLNCRQTTIRECSFRILSLSSSENVRFLSCTFTENAKPNGAGKFYLYGTDRILFDKCVFSNNEAYVGDMTQEPFFKIEDCLDVYARDCGFSNNKARFLVMRDKDIKLVNCKSEGNGWDASATDKPI
jgi:hypothetical protein